MSKKESFSVKVLAVGTKRVTAETTDFVRGVRVGTLLQLPIWIFPFEPRQNEEFTISVKSKETE